MTVPEGFKAPFLAYDKIRKYADRFLDEHHPERELPIPIYEIAEFKLEKKIAPHLGLQRDHGIDGFTSKDRKTIFVDEHVHDYVENRLRFTLGHEIGHIILHGNIFDMTDYSDITGWKTFSKSIPEDQYSFLEHHANCFAGLVLVPRERLIEEVGKNMTMLMQSIKKASKPINIRQCRDMVWDIIADQLSKTFSVSSDVIKKRLDYDRIQALYSTSDFSR